jgi:hypothetical protein
MSRAAQTKSQGENIGMKDREPAETAEGLDASKEAAPAQTFADVARLITGDEEPSWLVKTLEKWASSLMIDRGVAMKQPTRSELKKRLEGSKSAANTLIGALNDAATRDFLDAVPPGKIAYHGQIDQMLRDLVRRAEQAVAALSTKDGKTKPGRNKSMPPGASHPKTFCAALIAEAWTFTGSSLRQRIVRPQPQRIFSGTCPRKFSALSRRKPR